MTVADRFARHFSTYESEAVVQRRLADGLVSALAEASGRSSFGAAVELGCGTGLLTRAFRARFACRHLSLYDIVRDCPAFLQGLDGVSFTCADLETVAELPSADVVVSASCLQWLKDPARLFCVVQRALSVGGFFAAATFVEGNFDEIRQCGGQPLSCPSAAEWRAWLEAAGLRVRRFDVTSETLRFPTPLEAMRHLRRTGVMTPALGDYRSVRRFLARYAELGDATGVPLTYRPVLWVAEKE